MRHFVWLLIPLMLVTQANAAPPVEKEWTLLVFMNGFNNLDAFGKKDINEMEQVGSTEKVNVVVQWASYQAGDVKRLLVQKDYSTTQVSSPILENLGRIDMGDYRNLVEFVKWAKIHYPAKKYFIDVWNHGSGWHKKSFVSQTYKDISHDDYSGNSITTEQLGVAMSESATVLGQKVDIYGSDACLMSMIEVAGEMKDSVGVFIGSQHLEPGDGWPYHRLLNKWNQLPQATAAQVSKVLVNEYVSSFPNSTEITLSALDLNQYNTLAIAIRDLGNQLRNSTTAQKATILKAAVDTQAFDFDDYKDIGHFVRLLESRLGNNWFPYSMLNVKEALKHLVIANDGSSDMNSATGVSFWFPANRYIYDLRQARYKGLEFHADTQWGDILSTLYR